MKNFWTKLSVNVIAVFMVMMIMSVVPEIVPFEWFYYHCPSNVKHDVLARQHDGYSSYHWNWRHYVWIFMGISLFIVQLVRIIELCEKRNNNPNN